MTRSRRDIVKTLAATLGSLACPFVGGIHPLAWRRLGVAQAAGTEPHRFLQIFLVGGWDSYLAIDPVRGSKINGNFSPAYHDPSHREFAGSPVAVSAADNLHIGPGLAPALSAFQALPTAFVNGIYVEVTSHEFAQPYVLSGTLSLSRSREHPAFIATMADRTGGFPAHLVLGSHIPLADTVQTNPPLQALDVKGLSDILQGPYVAGGLKPASLTAAETLIAALDGNFNGGLSPEAKEGLQAWNAAAQGVPSFYGKGFGSKLRVTEAMAQSYGATGDASVGAKLAAALLSLKAGLTNFVTVTAGDFDTHHNHMPRQLPLMREFAVGLNQLARDLQTTNDPDAPGLKLADTTTVLISSDFVRSPLFNIANGTDHWQSGSAILMGKGIRANALVGGTDDAGVARGWANGDFAASDQKLLPDHVAASLLRLMGFGDEADKISKVHLNELFV